MDHLSDATPVGRRLDARIGATLMMVSVLSAFPAPIVGSGGQSGITLPAPTGSFGVGRATAEWTDRTRTEPLDATGGGRRLVVDVWYPAERTGGRAATCVDARAFSSLSAAGFRSVRTERQAHDIQNNWYVVRKQSGGS